MLFIFMSLVTFIFKDEISRFLFPMDFFSFKTLLYSICDGIVFRIGISELYDNPQCYFSKTYIRWSFKLLFMNMKVFGLLLFFLLGCL